MTDNEEYEVEKIVAQRVTNDVVEYRIRWRGYGADSDTWEPESHLIGCEIVLAEFKINNGITSNNSIKKDYEDGEVSESDSSNSGDDYELKQHKKNKKKNKKKKSRHKNTSKHVKNEENVSDKRMGIKIEAPITTVTSNDNTVKEKKKNSNIHLNLAMGASEILLRNQFCYGSSFNNSNVQHSDVKDECQDNSVNIKAELSVEGNSSRTEVELMKSHPPIYDSSDEENVQKTTIPENNMIIGLDSDDDDCDLDMDSQLRVVLNDDNEIEQKDKEPVDMNKSIDSYQESEKAKQWREHLDTATYKIKKSQRKEDKSNINGKNIRTTVTAKEKFHMNPKDVIGEAFGGLSLQSSIVDCCNKIEEDLESIKLSYDEEPTKEQIYRAIEEGNNSQLFKWYLKYPNLLKDGDYLLLCSRVGYSDIATIILRAGTDVNYSNDDGTTSLMNAAEYGHDLMVQLLITYGGYINTLNNKGESAIVKAVQRDNKDCLASLMMNGTDLHDINSESGPLLTARSRNLHEIDLFISDYHARYSERLAEYFVNMMNQSLTVCHINFPLRIVSQYEVRQFNFEFNGKISPVRQDECNLLAIFSAVVMAKQLKFCLDPLVNIDSIHLNDLAQQSLFENGSNCVTSLTPFVDGKNSLRIKAGQIINCRWKRLMVIGFRVKLNEPHN